MRHRYVYAAVICVSLVAVLIAGYNTVQLRANERSTEEVTRTYFEILNTGMRTNDFSALASVFAPDATLTRSNPKGQTNVYQGLEAITGFYQSLPANAPGYQWITDTLRPLSRDVALAYEQANGTPPLTVASRCAHVITVKKGKIVSYDWIVFFPGQK
ncbi:MAG: hypothetical protein NVSMB42_19700 [Herpetosiphon sp.]